MARFSKYHILKYIFWNVVVAFLFCVVGVQAESKLLNSNLEESEYANIGDIYTDNTTNQTTNQLRFIDKKILVKISPKAEFLEIGPGPGYATEKIAKNFSRTTVVEPIKAYQEIHKKRGYKTFGENFQNVNLHNHQYNFVLCSHVLYYIKRDQWGSFLKKIYNSIEPGGKALIILLAPKGGWADLHTDVRSDYSNSKNIELALNREGIKYDVSCVSAVFKYPNRKGFKKVVQTFTIDNCFSPEEFKQLSTNKKQQVYKKIDEYIDRCKQSDGSYKTTWQDGYVVSK